MIEKNRLNLIKYKMSQYHTFSAGKKGSITHDHSALTLLHAKSGFG